MHVQPSARRSRKGLHKTSRRLTWMLCCSAPSVADADAATGASAQPYSAEAILQQQPQPALFAADGSPKQSTYPVASPDTEAAPWQQPVPALLLVAHDCELQLTTAQLRGDAHSLGSAAGSAAAVGLSSRLGKAASCSLPLTHDSLSTATALFGSFSNAQGYGRAKGCKQQDTRDSPSEIHSDLQREAKALLGSSSSRAAGTASSTASSSQQPPPGTGSSTAHSSSSSGRSSTLQQQRDSSSVLLPVTQANLAAPQHRGQALQQQDSMGRDGSAWCLGAPAAAAAAATAAVSSSNLSGLGKHSLPVSSSGFSCQATTSSVAGWSEVLLPPSTTALASTAACGAHTAAAAAAGAASVGADAADAGDTDEDVDSLSLPPGLAAKLRKMESGQSFRMLQPELSASLRASDSLPADSIAAAGSCCSTPAAASGVLDCSFSGPGSGPVSRRSTAGFVPLGRSSPSHLASVYNPAGVQTPAGSADSAPGAAAAAVAAVLPATIPEHTSCSGSGTALTTAAAVAAAFESDAAAVQCLVEAAAAAGPGPRPHHSRSKSAGLLTTAAVIEEPPAALQAQPVAAVEAPSTTGVPGSTSSSTMPAEPPVQGAVARTLSVSSSPFAQIDCQKAVTASLLTAQQPAQRHSMPGDPTPAAAAGGSAPPTPVRLPGPVDGPLAAATPAGASSRISSSNSYRSMPYGLAALQQMQQGSGPGLGPSGLPAGPGSISMRPSLTSRLSWASTVTAGAAGAATPEPGTQVFALLNCPGSAADSAALEATGVGEQEQDDAAGRMLRPSKSLSSLSRLSSLRGNSGGSSLSRGTSFSSAWGAKQGKLSSKAKALFRLSRFKASAAAMLGGLTRSQSQPEASRLSPAAAAASTALGVPSAVVGTDSRLGGSGGSMRPGLDAGGGSSSNRQLAGDTAADPGAANPAGQHSSNSLYRPAATGSPVRRVLTQPAASPQQHLGPVPGRGSMMLQAPSGSQAAAALPPLPRPPSSFSLDQAAAATAATAGSRSSGVEGPFAAAQAALDASMLAARAAGSSGGIAANDSSGSSIYTPQRSSLRLSVSMSSAPMGSSQVLPEARSYGASSVGQMSSSGSSSGTGGSLMSLAVTRMHSAAAAAATGSRSCGSLPAAAEAPAGPGPAARGLLASQHSGSMPTLTSLDSGSIPASLSSSSKSSAQVAQAFAEAFLGALASGNTKWASDSAVGALLAEGAKMVGLDKQLYVGKAAIIRRLNGGMEQLVKMAEATSTDSTNTSTAPGPADAPEGPSATPPAAAAGSAGSVASLARKMPKPQLSVSCPDPKGKPSQVEAVYTFRWGIRKFTLRDELIVRGGQILRLRRSRG